MMGHLPAGELEKPLCGSLQSEGQRTKKANSMNLSPESKARKSYESASESSQVGMLRNPEF